MFLHSGYNYTEGPFSISCEINKRTFYWKVDDFHNVKAEFCDATEATQFYLKPRSHPEHLNEFYIVYYDSQNKKHVDPFLPHYLQRSVGIFGTTSNQQLKFGLYARDKDTPLALYKGDTTQISDAPGTSDALRRPHRSWTSVSLSSWINVQQPCILQHVRQGLLPSAFTAAIVIPGTGDDQEHSKVQVAEIEFQVGGVQARDAEEGQAEEAADAM